jgi:hypothetical protein
MMPPSIVCCYYIKNFKLCSLHLSNNAHKIAQTSPMKAKAIQKRNGKAIGNSIKHQLNALQLSIGCAPFWKARTTMIAIDNMTPVQDMQPNVIVVFLSVLSMHISYTQSLAA